MEPRFVKPLRIGNYDRNLVNEPARGFHNGRPCTRNTRSVREVRTSEEHSLGSVCSSISNRTRACSKYPGHAFEPDNSIVHRAKRVLREFRCNFTYAESGRVARDPFLWNFSFVPMENGRSIFPSKANTHTVENSFLPFRIESNRIESRSMSIPSRSVIRIHDPIFFESLLFSFLFQPRVSSIKLDGGSNKKRPRAKVCLEPVRARALARH